MFNVLLFHVFLWTLLFHVFFLIFAVVFLLFYIYCLLPAVHAWLLLLDICSLMFADFLDICLLIYVSFWLSAVWCLLVKFCCWMLAVSCLLVVLFSLRSTLITVHWIFFLKSVVWYLVRKKKIHMFKFTYFIFYFIFFFSVQSHMFNVCLMKSIVWCLLFLFSCFMPFAWCLTFDVIWLILALLCLLFNVYCEL